MRKLVKVETVLVIEDDADIRGCVVEALEGEGYTVVTAENGQEGIDSLRNAARLPDLIILDLMMPVKDGVEFRMEQQAEPRWKDIPVIVMTA
ncbi:MAG: response regulator, partial [Sulfurifustaceae bacterium]